MLDAVGVGQRLLVLAGLAGRQHEIVILPEGAGFRRRHEIEVAPAQQLLDRPAHQAAEGLVDEDKTMLLVLNQDGVGKSPDKKRQKPARIVGGDGSAWIPLVGRRGRGGLGDSVLHCESGNPDRLKSCGRTLIGGGRFHARHE